MGRVTVITGPHVTFGGRLWSSAIATDFNDQRAPSLRDLWDTPLPNIGKASSIY